VRKKPEAGSRAGLHRKYRGLRGYRNMKPMACFKRRGCQNDGWRLGVSGVIIENQPEEA